MYSSLKYNLYVFYVVISLGFVLNVFGDEFCASSKEGKCNAQSRSHMEEAVLHKWDKYLKKIEDALAAYKPCNQSCSCHRSTLKRDLAPFKDGITSEQIQEVADKGTKYQIIGGKVYRQSECMFPARCSGIEHFLLKAAPKLANLEMIVNVRDWPQVSKHFSQPFPVFSFSKTGDYYDIMYPAWSFHEGGPAIKLYPRGLGRWGDHRASLGRATKHWPWGEKEPRGFFRGSRTSAERDPLVLLSREEPERVDAKYTRNQAWKSEADTLKAPPAEEVSLEDHCRYRYLFNFRGVAASFRFKHLFLCGSLVFHVGSDWLEFFYPAMKPWVHYVPVPTGASQEQIRELLQFAIENDAEAHGIAERGQAFILEHLRMKDVDCYWRQLLSRYSKLLRYQVVPDDTLVLVPGQ